MNPERRTLNANPGKDAGSKSSTTASTDAGAGAARKANPPSKPATQAAAAAARQRVERPGISGSTGEVHGIRSLWVDKHRPMARKDLVGNGQQVNLLHAWLKCWGDEEAQAKERRGGSGKASKDNKDVHAFKAVLLSGTL
jgi:hypothetical protein